MILIPIFITNKILAPLLITYRVALGRAWDSRTNETLLSTIHFTHRGAQLTTDSDGVTSTSPVASVTAYDSRDIVELKNKEKRNDEVVITFMEDGSDGTSA